MLGHTDEFARPGWRSIRRVVAACFLVCLAGRGAAASDQMYFSAVDNVTNVLVGLINNETTRIDVATWLLSEHSVSIAIANRWHAGVPVRLIGDRGAIFESDPHTKTEFYWLASQGIPIRLRYNPTWYPEIVHWKAVILVGQSKVLFGSGNLTPLELAPFSSTNYDDESELVTDDPALVGAFKTKFDIVPARLEQRLRAREQLLRLPHAVPDPGSDEHQHRASRAKPHDAGRYDVGAGS